jgi:RNA polymerase sigma factor (sigma-70 family)
MATANLSTFLRRLTRGMAAETFGDLSDRRLVEQLLAGREEAAFEAVVRRHGPMVYRVCWRVLQHFQDTEDAFQATFLLLARKLASVRKRDSLASWLRGVAHRVALKAKAQAGTRRRHERLVCMSHAVPPDDITWRELRTALDAELVAFSQADEVAPWSTVSVLAGRVDHGQDAGAQTGGQCRPRIENLLQVSVDLTADCTAGARWLVVANSHRIVVWGITPGT